MMKKNTPPPIPEKIVIAPAFHSYESLIINTVHCFDKLGYKVGKGKRNVVKHIGTDLLSLNVKSFRPPNFINSLIYKHLRKSKAQRSYEYARYLLERNIGTPEPVAYLEYNSWRGLKKSFYISIHIKEDLTFRTLINQPGYPDRETILRQFTRFTYRMQEENILFLDHSPGNTLIVKRDKGEYDFFLVDLNRMRLNHQLSVRDRIRNFGRLAATDDMIAIISDEYARLTGWEKEWLSRQIKHYTLENHQRRARKKRIKGKLGK